jgi:hypothetical protein
VFSSGGHQQCRFLASNKGTYEGGGEPIFNRKDVTFDEQAEHHHKKRQGAYQANKASTGPSTTSSEKEKRVAAQEQQVVDRVPTDVMSVVTTPTTPALPGSVIRSILATNSKKKQTESVTIHHHTDVYSQQEK